MLNLYICTSSLRSSCHLLDNCTFSGLKQRRKSKSVDLVINHTNMPPMTGVSQVRPTLPSRCPGTGSWAPFSPEAYQWTLARAKRKRSIFNYLTNNIAWCIIFLTCLITFYYIFWSSFDHCIWTFDTINTYCKLMWDFVWSLQTDNI